MDQAELYKTQISFTEWFEKIQHAQSEPMRHEDNLKRERLAQLKRIIGIPFDEPYKFMATDISENNEPFQQFLQKHGHELCALRLVPTDPSLPKLRLRGLSIQKVVEEWFPKQDIDPTKYKANFVPHVEDYLWSTIFIITKNGIFGEITTGGHYQLTQGFYDKTPMIFSYDGEWKLSEQNEGAMLHVKEIVAKLRVDEDAKQKIADEMQGTFYNNHLIGYFETVSSREHGLWFIDWNRILGKMYEDFSLPQKSDAQLSGNSACKGKVTGKVRLITSPLDYFEQDDILVCNMTTPDLVPLMQKAAAIVTDKGGILSHAAIVSRELGVPCITGVGNATELLSNGDEVEVDADSGIVNLIPPKPL